MGKFNDIQEQSTQSWGSNSFTTRIESDKVVFDSQKDKFAFADPVEVPSLTVNGEPITPTEPQKQADWNQNNSEEVDYIKNRTHYIETTYETLVNETLSNPTAIGIVYTFLTNATFTFEEGKTYKVTVDGTEYEIEATLNGQVPFPVLVYGDMDPDNPVSGSFYIVAGNSMLISNFASDTEIETVDLKIDGPEETYHTLNDNFISSNIARTSDIKTVSYTSNTEGFTKKIGKISVGSTNYDVKIPLVNYTDYSGSIVTLEEGKFTVCSGTQTSISITWGGTTNVVNYMYAIFTAGENFVMPTSGKSNLSSLTQGTTYFLTVIGDSIKGWNYIFEEMVDLS